MFKLTNTNYISSSISVKFRKLNEQPAQQNLAGAASNTNNSGIPLYGQFNGQGIQQQMLSTTASNTNGIMPSSYDQFSGQPPQQLQASRNAMYPYNDQLNRLQQPVIPITVSDGNNFTSYNPLDELLTHAAVPTTSFPGNNFCSPDQLSFPLVPTTTSNINNTVLNPPYHPFQRQPTQQTSASDNNAMFNLYGSSDQKQLPAMSFNYNPNNVFSNVDSGGQLTQTTHSIAATSTLSNESNQYTGENPSLPVQTFPLNILYRQFPEQLFKYQVRYYIHSIPEAL